MNVPASTKYRLQVEKMQIGNIQIFHFKDKSTRISQPCVGLLVPEISISEKPVGITSKKTSIHFLSEPVEYDGINSTSARI